MAPTVPGKLSWHKLLWVSVALLLAVAALFALPSDRARADPAGAVTFIYVAADAPGPIHDGLSWATAFTEVQPALVYAATTPGEDEIWVAEGVYRPDFDPDSAAYTGYVTATFVLTDGVSLFGGFTTAPDVLGQRSPDVYVTVLSGDVDDNDTVDAQHIVRAADDIMGANAYHVVTAVGVDASVVIDGFTITGGHAHAGSPHNIGGGMANNAASPTVSHVVFSGNAANFGGGGMANYNGSQPVVSDVVFTGNRADGGGGLFNWDAGDVTLVNVIFRNNTANYFGGGLKNTASAPVLIDVVFSGNYAVYNGGGLENFQSEPQLVNVTFNGNAAGSEGGGVYNDTGSLTLRNGILWENQDGSGTETAGAQISNASSTVIISTTLVQGSGGSGVGWNAALGTDGGGNLDVDPQFVVPVDPGAAPTAAGNVRLTFGSPAMDAGDDAAVTVAADVDGGPRFIAPHVDMGAYEVEGVCFATVDAATVYSSTTALAVQHAVDAAGHGQTVKVAGACAGVLTRAGLVQSVYISKSLTLRGGYVPTDWTVSAPVTNPTTLDAQGLGRVLYITGAGQVAVENVRLVDGHTAGAGQVSGGCIRVADTDVTLSGCEILGGVASNGGGVAFLGNSNGRVVNTLFARNWAGSTGAAIYFGTSGRADILHTTIASPTLTTRSGVCVGVGTVHITNTLIANHTVGILQNGANLVTEDYNLFSDIQTPTANMVSGIHSIVGDANFVDPVHDHYRLATGSDAIDMGKDVGVDVDFEGDARPLGDAVDIGYDEFIPPTFRIYVPLVMR